MKKIEPMGDRVAVKPDPKEKQTEGLTIPDQNLRPPTKGTVVAVGPGKEGVKMQCKEGDRVIYSEYSGQEIHVEGQEYRVMREVDIYCIIK